MTASSPVPVSVVIAARNEAGNIAECVRSVSWADEVIVSDGGSSDETVSLATQAGARALRAGGATIGHQRNEAIDAARNDWIFVVDADERATPEVGAEIAKLIPLATHDAYRIGRENIFLGEVIRHGGWESGRDRPVRLFRKPLRYDDNLVHEGVRVPGSPGELRSVLRHTPYATLEQYFQKLDRYSGWWARQNFERGRRAGLLAIPTRMVARFFSAYILRGGWRDGARGAVLAGLGAISVFAKYARLWELGLRSGRSS